MADIKIGQILFEKTKGNIYERAVDRVGRTYFYVNNVPFNLITLQYNSKEYSQCNRQLYLTKEEII